MFPYSANKMQFYLSQKLFSMAQLCHFVRDRSFPCMRQNCCYFVVSLDQDLFSKGASHGLSIVMNMRMCSTSRCLYHPFPQGHIFSVTLLVLYGLNCFMFLKFVEKFQSTNTNLFSFTFIIFLHLFSLYYERLKCYENVKNTDTVTHRYLIFFNKERESGCKKKSA